MKCRTWSIHHHLIIYNIHIAPWDIPDRSLIGNLVLVLIKCFTALTDDVVENGTKLSSETLQHIVCLRYHQSTSTLIFLHTLKDTSRIWLFFQIDKIFTNPKISHANTPVNDVQINQTCWTRPDQVITVICFNTSHHCHSKTKMSTTTLLY